MVIVLVLIFGGGRFCLVVYCVRKCLISEGMFLWCLVSGGIVIGMMLR